MSKVANIKPEKKDTEVKTTERTRELTPFEEMEKYFENLWHRRWSRSMAWDWPRLADLEKPFAGKLPKVDVIDREKDVLLKAEVPGVKKDDLKVSVTDHTITIKGETSHEEKEEKGEFYRSERTHGAFSRTITLPADVDSEHAKANYKDGLLEVIVPKVKKAQSKIVEVK